MGRAPHVRAHSKEAGEPWEKPRPGKCMERSSQPLGLIHRRSLTLGPLPWPTGEAEAPPRIEQIPTGRPCLGPGVPEPQDRSPSSRQLETGSPAYGGEGITGTLCGQRGRQSNTLGEAGAVGRAGGACCWQALCVEQRGFKSGSSVEVGCSLAGGAQYWGWGCGPVPVTASTPRRTPAPPQGSPEPPGGRVRDPSGGGILHPWGPADSSGNHRNPAGLGWADLSHWQGRRKPSRPRPAPSLTPAWPLVAFRRQHGGLHNAAWAEWTPRFGGSLFSQPRHGSALCRPEH